MTDAEAPLVLETPGGLSVSYRGRLLYSGRDPSGLARKLAAACDTGPSRLLLVPSPLLWYGLAELLAAMGEGSAVLCVEADPALAKLARRRMPSSLAAEPRLSFIESGSCEEAAAAAAELGDFRACALVPLSGGVALNSGLYRAMAASLNAGFEAEWRNRAALMILGRRWARNIFDNIASLPDIEARPPPRFRGPVIVCGAGPSLESALPLLRRLRSGGPGLGASIVACDTALGTLLAAGLEPDLTVCLEGQAHNLPDFTRLGDRPIALAADLSSHPATFRAVRGRKHLSLVRITRSPFLDRVAGALLAAGIPYSEIPPLGSVGVHAFHLARSLSSGPIFAVGLDFCFEPGKTHARGCPSMIAEELSLSRLSRWPNQYAASFRDRTIKTEGLLSDPILLSYAALLAEAASESGESGAPLYDIRGRGPSIGCRRISLATAEELLAESGPRTGGVEAGILAGGPEVAALSRAAVSRAAASLLRAEEGRLEVLRAAMHGSKPLGKEEFRRLVHESDYLFWAFPDRARSGEPDLPQDFMNRLVPEAEYWAYRLGELTATLE